MDQRRFTALKRSLGSLPSRRDILRGLAGAGLGLSALRLSAAAEAKNKKKKHGKKRKHQNQQPATVPPTSPPPPPQPGCTPNCTGKTCGDDGCGGTCGTCPGAQDVCQNGTCICVPQCAPANACGSDGCGGSCGTCAPDPICRSTTELTTHVCLGGTCTQISVFSGVGQVCFQNDLCSLLPEPTCHKQPVSDGCGHTYPPNCGQQQFCCDRPGGDLVCQATQCL